MYGESILNSNWVRRKRADAANLACGILLKSMWGREDWIFNVNDAVRGGEKLQVPLENKKVKFESHKP